MSIRLYVRTSLCPHQSFSTLKFPLNNMGKWQNASFPFNNMENLQKNREMQIDRKMKTMQNSYWITWKIDEKMKTNVKFLLNNMENWPEIEKNIKLPLNIMENCLKGLKYAFSGCIDIHPCVLQDIGPLGSLPCSHSTSSADHSKLGIGYRWPCAILGWLVVKLHLSRT